jgi:site-specific recombinase XerD
MAAAFPSADELAAFRAWLAGMGSRAAVDQFLADRRSKGESSRAGIGSIRRRLIEAAVAAHREDMASALQAKPRSRAARALPALIETLRHLKAPVPSAADRVTQWLPARVAGPLTRAGVATLGELAHCVGKGGRWWKRMPGVGVAAAQTAEQFVHATPSLKAAALAPSAPGASSLSPWESLRAPRDLDGSQGIFRAPRTTCVLSANNDLEAAQAWLSLYESPATLRSYRKEVERLILWCIVERNKPLSSLTTEDAVAYRSFLRRPSPKERWVGPVAPRSSQARRPFQAALSPRSAAYALQVINAMFRWLIEQRYVLANPFAGIKVRGCDRRGPIDASRALSAHEWTLIRRAASLSELADKMLEASHARLLFLLDFSYATGLRADELVSARLGQIRVDDDAQYWLQVRGKGDKPGEVVLPPLARSALERYLRVRGLSVQPESWDPNAPVVASMANEQITASRLWRIMKTFFRRAAELLEPVNPNVAERSRSASPHCPPCQYDLRHLPPRDQ